MYYKEDELFFSFNRILGHILEDVRNVSLLLSLVRLQLHQAQAVPRLLAARQVYNYGCFVIFFYTCFEKDDALLF